MWIPLFLLFTCTYDLVSLVLVVSLLFLQNSLHVKEQCLFCRFCRLAHYSLLLNCCFLYFFSCLHQILISICHKCSLVVKSDNVKIQHNKGLECMNLSYTIIVSLTKDSFWIVRMLIHAQQQMLNCMRLMFVQLQMSKCMRNILCFFLVFLMETLVF